jgi:hypothetical protein
VAEAAAAVVLGAAALEDEPLVPPAQADNPAAAMVMVSAATIRLMRIIDPLQLGMVYG